MSRKFFQFPVLDPAKLSPSIKTSRRYIGSHINHSTLSSSDKAQSHPLSSTFIHFIHCPGPFVATCQPQVLVELPSPCQGESVCFTTFIHFHPFSLAVPSCTWRSIQSQVWAIRGAYAHQNGWIFGKLPNEATLPIYRIIGVWCKFTKSQKWWCMLGWPESRHCSHNDGMPWWRKWNPIKNRFNGGIRLYATDFPEIAAESDSDPFKEPGLSHVHTNAPRGEI